MAPGQEAFTGQVRSLNDILVPLTKILYHANIILYKRQINLKAGNPVTFFISTLHPNLKSHVLKLF